MAAGQTSCGPRALWRLTVPRLSGHSAQDTQAYKSEALLAEERSRDPLPRLHDYLVPNHFSQSVWDEILDRAQRDVKQAVHEAYRRPLPDPGSATRYAFFSGEVQQQGGLMPEGHRFPTPVYSPQPEATRANMITAIRRTLESELASNPKVVVFGEDVGPKGGVHGVTLGLQEKFGSGRVFDTSLNEEGIIGRAVGMAAAGLMPVAEIQFRKYADPAEEQLNDCGTMRWRTNNRFAAPMVVRMPGGFLKCGDPWHSQSGEVKWAHATGWQVAMPSNAEDAVGLLRYAMRDNNPTIFFEHRHLLDAASARRPYPGDDYLLPFGKARLVKEGGDVTVVTWGAMAARCQEAMQDIDGDLIDLRTLVPWDRTAVLASVAKTHRCLIVHEDNITAGFGAEIAAVLAREAFYDLDAPLERLATPDVPPPHSPVLLDAVIPGVADIRHRLEELLSV